MNTVAAEEARFAAQGDGRFAVSGALTFYTVPGLYEQDTRALLQASGPIAIDLGDVSRADSAGLALLVEWLRRAHENGLPVRYVNVPEQVRSLARVNGLSGALRFDDSN